MSTGTEPPKDIRQHRAYIPTITARTLASDTPPPFKIAPVEPVGDTSSESPTRSAQAAITAGLLRRKSTGHYARFTVGVLLLAGLAFLLVPKKWVPKEGGDIATTTATISTAPSLNDAESMRKYGATPGEWIKNVPIGGVRTELIIVDGTVYRMEESIAPFDLRWTGRTDNGNLTFQLPTGGVFTREYAR